MPPPVLERKIIVLEANFGMKILLLLTEVRNVKIWTYFNLTSYVGREIQQRNVIHINNVTMATASSTLSLPRSVSEQQVTLKRLNVLLIMNLSSFLQTDKHSGNTARVTSVKVFQYSIVVFWVWL